MAYKPIVKHPQYLVWEDDSKGELLYTGVLGDIAWAPKTFEMNSEEILKFRNLGEKYLADLRMQLEREFRSEYWTSRFIKDFDKQPGIKDIIEDRSYLIPVKADKKPGLFAKLFGSD
ncbi:MAG TPA: hypothetical protein VE954_27440 [Oligoflexus sp.]|uniref:hypothetical protein n=1 Tax=Oligoflexus sp. TaxID=1971216 RepID=UPI002D273D02|nr:hypothetical protein [Oligoflexus sp.]HYX36859.1 hypothetical protein [Oligoflexus sp.]